MNTDMTVLRDVPQCSALAGAVPCNLIDFSGVTTAFGFAVKMEELHELVKFSEIFEIFDVKVLTDHFL